MISNTKKLRHQIVLNLHTANQGYTSIIARARQVVYWPGMDRDINNHVELCPHCREIAPSKPNDPLYLLQYLIILSRM